MISIPINIHFPTKYKAARIRALALSGDVKTARDRLIRFFKKKKKEELGLNHEMWTGGRSNGSGKETACEYPPFAFALTAIMKAEASEHKYDQVLDTFTALLRLTTSSSSVSLSSSENDTNALVLDRSSVEEGHALSGGGPSPFAFISAIKAAGRASPSAVSAVFRGSTTLFDSENDVRIILGMDR